MSPDRIDAVIIRAACAADADALTRLYLSARRTLLSYAPLAHDDAAVAYWMAQILIPQADVRVAEQDGQVVGFYALSEDEQGGWLDQLYLLPSRTGEGLGTGLLEHALQHATYPLRLFTFQQNSIARALYEKHGFIARSFSDGRNNEEGVPDILYQKEMKAD